MKRVVPREHCIVPQIADATVAQFIVTIMQRAETQQFIVIHAKTCKLIVMLTVMIMAWQVQ